MTTESSKSPAESGFEPEMLKVYVDVYKHHFDLWLKGYVVYLAVIGSTAGFIFADGTPDSTRQFLLLFSVTVSAVSLVAWYVGWQWARAFAGALVRVSPSGAPPLALRPFQVAIVLGFFGAVVILAGTIFLYNQLPNG